MESAGLAPSAVASPEKLIRRVYLDLIGLPPTPEEVEEYLRDPSTARFEQVVDELLSRPQFGERWARPWLDLARYADSHGFQRDNLRDIWAYRDWVIQALNDDMPFDQFTIEQIAGDLLPQPTESQRIATGFHRCAPINVEAGSLPEETRSEQIIDRTNTTAAVWLGSTMECCQCHDHKYDPFSQQDYYRLLAFFNSTELEADRTSAKPSSIQFSGPKMPISNPARDAKRTALEQQLQSMRVRQNERREELSQSVHAWLPELQEELGAAPRQHPLQIIEFQSTGTTDTVQVLKDGAILLEGGDPPETDTYTIRAQSPVSNIRGFRLDALRHESLPGGGPGRGDPVKRNFVLNELSVELRPTTDQPDLENALPRSLRFSKARASFSQTNWAVDGVLSDKPKTGWAISPRFDQSHWATFVLEQPLDVPEGWELVFQLKQDYGGARTIGCLRLSAVTGDIDATPIPEAIGKIAARPVDEWSPKERKQLVDYRVAHDYESHAIEQQQAQLQKEINQLAPDTTLVMVELDQPRTTHVFERGDYREQGDVVQPDVPGILHALPEGPRNRLTLARWLTSTDNPLVARVTVNRWWAELFGRGIVATPEDFGIKGDPPSHPQLLDWLAVEFMDNGWSMKKLLRTIVLSATYQQSSRVRPELQSLDRQNRLLARGPRFRMDAEMIRDNALAISGLLSLNSGGPPIRPYQPAGVWKKVGGTAYEYRVSPGSEQHRRGIYVVRKRGSPYPSFTNFDGTPRLSCTVMRSRTNTPLQALTLLNDPVYVEAAKALVTRVNNARPDSSIDERLEYAFQLCTARRPSTTELATLRGLYDQQIASHQDRELTDEEAIQDAWYGVATTLLNLHETITKD